MSCSVVSPDRARRSARCRLAGSVAGRCVGHGCAGRDEGSDHVQPTRGCRLPQSAAQLPISCQSPLPPRSTHRALDGQAVGCYRTSNTCRARHYNFGQRQCEGELVPVVGRHEAQADRTRATDHCLKSDRTFAGGSARRMVIGRSLVAGLSLSPRPNSPIVPVISNMAGRAASSPSSMASDVSAWSSKSS